MSWPTAVVIIVMMVVVAKVMNARYRAQHGIIEDKQGNQSYIQRDDPERDREIEELRERIHILEKITVDGREARAIADEIESLREEQKQ